MTPGQETPLVVRRVLAIPRERVFAAWLDPVLMTRWMCPGGGSATVDLDPRVGGKFRIVMHHEGEHHDHWGEYLAIEPPARLSFTWISAYTDHRPTVVTVELLERAGSTELVLTHRALPPGQLDAHRQGWTEIAEKLGLALQTGLQD